MSDRKDPVGWDEALGEHAANPPTPRTTGGVLLAFGREWRIAPDEARIKAQFEHWVKRNATITYQEIEQEDPDEGARLRQLYMEQRAAGSYTWDGRCCRTARGDAPGLYHLLYLMLRRCHPEITERQARDIARSNWPAALAALGEAMGNWDTPTCGGSSECQTTPAQPTSIPKGTTLAKEEVSGSAWSGTKTSHQEHRRPPSEDAPYTEEDVRRAEAVLASMHPATIDGN